MLINTPAMPAAARFFAMRKSVKGFTDSLLDLIVNDRYVLYVLCLGKYTFYVCCVEDNQIDLSIVHLNMIVLNHILNYGARSNSCC